MTVKAIIGLLENSPIEFLLCAQQLKETWRHFFTAALMANGERGSRSHVSSDRRLAP